MRFRMILCLVAALSLLLPPDASATECVRVYNASLIFYTDCYCYACTGGAAGDCSECWDDGGQWCQTDELATCPPQKKPLHPIP